MQTIEEYQGNNIGRLPFRRVRILILLLYDTPKGDLFRMVLILPRTDIRCCLNMAETVEAMRIALGALRSWLAQAPQRMAVGLSEQGVALFMPSLLQTLEQHAFGL